MRRFYLVSCVLYLLFCCNILHSEAAEEQPPDTQKEAIRVTAPLNNDTVIAKKPAIKAAITTPYEKDSLIVMLDNSDITGVLNLTADGLEYTPIEVLQPGPHTLSIKIRTTDGRELQKEYQFTTRHSAAFETAYTTNELTTVYETVIKKPDTAVSVPNSKITANLQSHAIIKEKEWESTLTTNLRYLDQSAEASSSLKKGIDTANWLFTGAYTKDSLSVKTSIGDIELNETSYTITGLNRRGGKLSFDYGGAYQVSVFSVKSPQVIGLKGGTGIDNDTDNHILGISAGAKLFDKKAEIKSVYITGGDYGDSSGTSTSSQVLKKGDVLGLILTTDFFENKLRTELEADYSRFDSDTSDEFERTSDKAYKMKFSGTLGRYNYEALYENIGKDYAGIWNQGLQKDREGVSLKNGATLGVHSINLTVSRYNDNVNGDTLVQRSVYYQSYLDYSFNKIPNLPIGLTYQKNMQQSKSEPEGSTPISLYTDAITGRVSYSMNKVNLAFQTMYSLLNDKTSSNSDSRVINYALAPSYTAANLTITPNVSLNKSKTLSTNVTSDTYTLTLDLMSKWFNNKLSCNVGGTYGITKTDDGLTDTRNLSATFRLALNAKEFIKSLLNPTIGVRGVYSKTDNKIAPGSNSEDMRLFLVLTSSTPFSY